MQSDAQTAYILPVWQRGSFRGFARQNRRSHP